MPHERLHRLPWGIGYGMGLCEVGFCHIAVGHEGFAEGEEVALFAGAVGGGAVL